VKEKHVGFDFRFESVKIVKISRKFSKVNSSESRGNPKFTDEPIGSQK
jgi:hypothetical protein